MLMNRIRIYILVFFYLAITFLAWFKPAEEISDSELRPLAQFPELSAKTIVSGSFMSEFEKYTLDQFPFRDRFRTLKAVTYLYGFGRYDNNGIYIEEGYSVKMEYPMNRESVEYAVGRLKNVYQKHIAGSGSRCYVSVIPDKNFYLAASHGALAMDYDTLFDTVKEGMDFAEYIDISNILEEKSFYRTDTHWDQSCIREVAQRLAGCMNVTLDTEFRINTADAPFYGVYYGQAALPQKPDDMKYVTNDAIASAKVIDRQNDRIMPVYDESRMATRSPYDFFLGGPLSLIEIENPLAENDRNLVVFRDSFGSSLVPLLISGYRKITVADIRYIPGDRIGKFIDFKNSDVLFLYSTLILNNSSTLK